MFRSFAASRSVAYLKFSTLGLCVLTLSLVAYVLPITLPTSNTKEVARSSAGSSQPLLVAEVMTSKGLVAAQAGKQEIYADPLGPGSKRVAQLASLEMQSSNIPDTAPTPDTAPAPDATAKSSEGSMELALPNGWRDIKPEGVSTKLAATNGKGSRVVVRVYPKEDFKGANAFAEFAVNNLKLSDDNGVNKSNIEITGKPAVRLSVVGTASNEMRVGYLITILESEGMYVEVIGRTDAYSFAKETPVLGAFASALKFTSSTTPTPSPPTAGETTSATTAK